LRDRIGARCGHAVCIFLIVCASCIGPAAHPDSAPPEVRNGGFEEIQGEPDALQPKDWSMRVYGGEVRSGLDAQVRHDGQYSATLEALSTQDPASAALYHEMGHKLQEGQYYTVTFWVKKTSLAKVGIRVWADGGAHFESQAYWDFQSDFTQWHKIQFCFQARRTATKSFGIWLSLSGVAGDQVWYDDVSCQPGRPALEEPEPQGLAERHP